MAVTLWRLATYVEYRNMSQLFGIGISTVREIVNDTYEVIGKHLVGKYVFHSSGAQLREIVNGFESCWGSLRRQVQ